MLWIGNGVVYLFLLWKEVINGAAFASRTLVASLPPPPSSVAVRDNVGAGACNTACGVMSLPRDSTLASSAHYSLARSCAIWLFPLSVSDSID